MNQVQHKSRIFALTGGVGSGKSTVADIWREDGIFVVSADELARQAAAPGSVILEAVTREFGEEYLFPDGTLDRKKLGARVFSDPDARERLNQIIHPEVRRLAEVAFEVGKSAGAELICYDIPLLFETAQQALFRPVVVVTATPLQQMERVAARDALTPAEAAARLRSQIPLREKEALADIVIVNGGTLDDLRRRARKALQEVRAWRDET